MRLFFLLFPFLRRQSKTILTITKEAENIWQIVSSRSESALWYEGGSATAD